MCHTKRNNSYSKGAQAYYAQIFNDAKDDIRKTWKIINATISKLNYETDIPQTFKIDNKNISDPNIIANANNISPSAKGSANYLQLKKPRNHNSIFLTPTDPSEIIDVLKSLKAKNSSGHNHLSTKFFKLISLSVANPISKMINKSLQAERSPIH